MNELTINVRNHLRAEKLYLVALAIDVTPLELLGILYGELKLKNSLTYS